MTRGGQGGAGLWRHRDFMKLWSAATVSQAGFHITVLAMQLTAALVLDATPVQMGLLVATESASTLLVGLVAGVWVDRLRRRPLLIAADVGRAAVLLLIPLSVPLGFLGMPLLYAVAFTVGVFNVLFDVAQGSYLPSLVGRHRVFEGNSKLIISNSVMVMAGPNLAGLLVQLLSAPIALVGTAGTYIASVLVLGGIRRTEAAPRSARSSASSTWHEVREGVRALLSHSVLRALMFSGINFAFFAGMRAALVVLFLTGSRSSGGLGLEPATVGLIYGVGGVGALLGALIAQRVAQFVGLGRAIVAVHLMVGLLALVTPLAGLLAAVAVVPVLMIGQFGYSFWGPVWGVNGRSLQQALIQTALLGRILASNRVTITLATPAGAVAGGALGQLVGLQLALIVSGIGIALGALWLSFSPVPKIRTIPEEPDEPERPE